MVLLEAMLSGNVEARRAAAVAAAKPLTGSFTATTKIAVPRLPVLAGDFVKVRTFPSPVRIGQQSTASATSSPLIANEVTVRAKKEM